MDWCNNVGRFSVIRENLKCTYSLVPLSFLGILPTATVAQMKRDVCTRYSLGIIYSN